MMREIEPVEYIIANQLNYLSGRVIQLITEYGVTKDIQVLEEACRDLAALVQRERFIEERFDANGSD
ncbi:MAG: hypothetical protein ACPH10_06305 [Litorivicinaceae bacterium]